MVREMACEPWCVLGEASLRVGLVVAWEYDPVEFDDLAAYYIREVSLVTEVLLFCERTTNAISGLSDP